MSTPIIARDVVPKALRRGPEVLLPLYLLLDLHNALPDGHRMRTAICGYIADYSAANPKAHWTRAVVRMENGELVFDETLWDVAVYRGKQETRLRAGEEAFKQMRDQLDLLSSFIETEAQLAAEVKPSGTPLVGQAAPSPSLAHVRQHHAALRDLLERMDSGLANNIAGTLSGDDLPAEIKSGVSGSEDV